jgi:hypothetical protein
LNLSKALEEAQRALYLSEGDRDLIRVYLRQINDELERTPAATGGASHRVSQTPAQGGRSSSRGSSDHLTEGRC